MSVAVRFDKVSKCFTLHKERPRSLQELMLNALRGKGNGAREEFWALRDVSFEVRRGETVGIIGPNGAGKSTVLKLIAGIIKPTSGTIEVNGRIGALLELGAGFHPDLTGRENIYLSGSILGLKRGEIRRRLDEIIAFAELERFIDVPVKHYSSGMYVRLAFSVAVHMDPEILLVDEVLAVGDAAFQRKCLERIDQMRRKGVTILLVSHDMDSVRRFCSRALWFEKGRLLTDDTTEAVVQRYIARSWEKEGRRLKRQVTDEQRWGTRRLQITRVRLLNGDGREQSLFRTGEPLTVEISYRSSGKIEHPVFGLAIHRSDGVHVTGPNTHFAGLDIPFVEGEGIVTYTVPSLPLLEGLYYVSVSSHNREDTEMFDYHDRAYPFRVVGGSIRERYGLVSLGGKWQWKRLT